MRSYLLASAFAAVLAVGVGSATTAQAGSVIGKTLHACLEADFRPNTFGYDCQGFQGSGPVPHSNVFTFGTPAQAAGMASTFTVASPSNEIFNYDGSNAQTTLNIEDGSMLVRYDMLTSSSGTVPIKLIIYGFNDAGLSLTSISNIVGTGAWRQNGPVQFGSDFILLGIGGLSSVTGAYSQSAGIGYNSAGSSEQRYGQMTFNFSADDIIPAPAPATLALLGSGIAGLLVAARRRRA